MKILRHILRNEAGADGSSGGGGAVEGSAPAVAAPVASAPALPAPTTPQAGSESLLQRPSAAAPAAAPAAEVAPAASAPADWRTKVPEKFVVKGADGSADPVATLIKQAESYTHLEKSKSLAPATPTDYTFTPPEEFKELVLDDAASNAFREKAHKAGMSQAQYELVMNEYLAEVPKMLDAAAKLSADDCRAELGKVWKGEAMSKGISAAQRAIDGAPPDVRDAAWEKFGRDPDFIRVMAHYGQQMAEGKAPVNADGGGTVENVDSLMASEAYRNARHPDHAAVSAKVNSHYRRVSGDRPVTL